MNAIHVAEWHQTRPVSLITECYIVFKAPNMQVEFIQKFYLDIEA